MIWNPWSRIIALELELRASESARLRAEDENRRLYDDCRNARVALDKALEAKDAQSAKFQDWLAMSMGRPAIHRESTVKPPEPLRKPITQGVDLERTLMQQLEQELGIDAVN